MRSDMKKDKFTPKKEKEYVVSDQCFWQELTPEECEAYNPYDKKRMPHLIQLMDVETGTIVNLPSGSVIKVIKYRPAPTST
jgi:hypothetical protein